MRTLLLLSITAMVMACNKDKDVTGSPEILVFDSVITTTVNDHGFFYFYAPTTNGTNWLEPYDFYNGTFQCRYEILQYPTQKTFLISLCIWSDMVGKWENYRETCSKQFSVTGNGIYTSQSSPSSWWKQDEPVDFSRVDDFYSLGMVLWCDNYQNLSDWTYGSEDCWARRKEILPLTLRLTVIAVADGYDFSGWEEYIE